MDSWNIIRTAPASGAYNMAFDSALAKSNTDIPILRLYSWDPSAISIGYHQSTGKIDLDACRAAEIGVVRRPTGGRAIFHSEELTYSVIYPGKDVSLTNIYENIHKSIALALAKIGIEASLTPAGKPLGKLPKQAHTSPCFSSSALTELQVGGRKMVGSAGRQFDAAFLMHGSILLGQDHIRLSEFLDLPEGQRALVRESLSSKTISAEKILGRTVSPSELEQPMIDGFSEIFNIEISHAEIEDSLISSVRESLSEFDLTIKDEAAA